MAAVSPQPSPGRSKKPIIAIAGVVGAVAVLGIALVLMFGFRSSPSDTVQQYIDLQLDGQYVEMLDQTTTDGYAQRFRDDEWDGGTKPPDEWVEDVESETVDFEIKDESIDGDKATVTIDQVIDGGDPEKVNLYLVQEDGEWLIDSTDQND